MNGKQIKSMVEKGRKYNLLLSYVVMFQHWWIYLFSLLALFTDDLRDNSIKKK